ncbi:peptide MFS transporter [Dermabacteraceae bacterium P7074]
MKEKVGMTQQNSVREKSFFGHPPMLARLFNVEMWERFSFYGLQGILVLYIYWDTTKGGLGLSEAIATSIVGAYGGSVFLFTIVGAFVSDRLLGPERTMFYSGILIMAGHISLALLSGFTGLAIGLLLVASGSGGLKASIVNLVSSLYKVGDPRRDSGFSIFYMGLNLGALVGPLLTGYAQKEYGFHVGFGIAAAGMFIGLVQYSMARRNLPASVHEVPNPLPAAHRLPVLLGAIAVSALIAFLLLGGFITPDHYSDAIMYVAIVAAIVMFGILLTSKKVTSEERPRVYAFMPLFMGISVFTALFQQEFTVITLYSDKRLDRVLFGYEIPVSWVQSINPVYIILLTPLLVALWTKMGSRQPVTPVKFAFGLFLIGTAFLLFIPMAHVAKVPFYWICLILLAATMAELLVSPVGLSLSTKLAPKAYPVLMVSLFYMSWALGTALSGVLAGYYSTENEVAYFGVLGTMAVVAGVLMLVGVKPIHRAMRGVE